VTSPSELSGLQVDMVKLLESCVMHLDQAQKDTERVRARLANLPWDIMNERGKGALEEARMFLHSCEDKLAHAKKQIELQKNSAGKA
jgi:exonuclease VII small subunit